MSKHKLLSNEEIKNYKVNEQLLLIINDYSKQQNIPNENLKILDYGHGRGRSVAKLRNLGYQAYGVEIDSIPYYNGIPWFENHGYNPNSFLHLIKEDCLTPFPDDFFDIVFSEQVIEHIADISIVVEEISRITKKGGWHYHVFPAKWHFLESHLFMPMIHWFPKNKWRKKLIKLFVSLGIEPKWDIGKCSSLIEKTNTYWNYSINKTFYRNKKTLKKVFIANKFQIKFSIIRLDLSFRSLFGLFPSMAIIYAEKL